MKEDIPTETTENKKTWLDQLPISFEKKFWNSEKIISLSAFIVSIATLLALMYQIRLSGEQNELARKQQYASVLPYLEIWTKYNSGNMLFSLTTVNNGVGPAFIDDVRIVYEGQAYPGDPWLFYQNEITLTDSINVGYSNLTAGRVIPAGEEIDLIFASASFSSEKDQSKLSKWFGRPTEKPALARLEITYSSVYGERWVTKGIAAVPEPIPNENSE